MNNSKISIIALLMLLPMTASATLISSADVINDWTSGGSAIDGVTNGVWQQSGISVVGTGNHVGSLVSDFSTSGNFSFSLDTRARDDDLFGLMWGVQDLSNHYRFSWGLQRHDSGTSGWNGGGGFRIFKEVGGATTQLFSSNSTYVIGQNYNLNVTGTGSGFNVMITNTTTNSSIFNQSIADTTFTSGKVGIHEWYQGGSNVWSNFDITTVPEPSTLAIFGLGLMGLASRRFKKTLNITS